MRDMHKYMLCCACSRGQDVEVEWRLESGAMDAHQQGGRVMKSTRDGRGRLAAATRRTLKAYAS